MWLDPQRYEIVDDAMASVLHGKSPAERLEIACGLWRSARSLIQNKLSQDHPEWDDEQILRATARRMAGGPG